MGKEELKRRLSTQSLDDKGHTLIDNSEVTNNDAGSDAAHLSKDNNDVTSDMFTIDSVSTVDDREKCDSCDSSPCCSDNGGDESDTDDVKRRELLSEQDLSMLRNNSELTKLRCRRTSPEMSQESGSEDDDSTRIKSTKNEQDVFDNAISKIDPSHCYVTSGQYHNRHRYHMHLTTTRFLTAANLLVLKA